MYVFFGLLKVNGGVRIFLVNNGGVRITFGYVYLRSTEVYVFFWFT